MKIFLKYDINKMDQLNKNNTVPLFTINYVIYIKIPKFIDNTHMAMRL